MGYKDTKYNEYNDYYVFLHIKFMTTAFEDQHIKLRIRIVGL